jgi:hypothetical protein
MTETQHTPGPWSVIDTIYRTFHIVDHEGVFVADTDRCNARLIAAAPELLAALQAVADYWAGGDVPADIDAAMRAAIIKATGGQS